MPRFAGGAAARIVADSPRARNRPPAREASVVASGHRAQDGEHDDRADGGDHQRAQPPGRLVLAEHVDPQEAADDAAQDADEHGADAAHALAAGDEGAGQRAGDEADDDPSADAELTHEFLLVARCWPTMARGEPGCDASSAAVALLLDREFRQVGDDGRRLSDPCTANRSSGGSAESIGKPLVRPRRAPHSRAADRRRSRPGNPPAAGWPR